MRTRREFLRDAALAGAAGALGPILEAGDPIVILGGKHVGWFELPASARRAS